MQFRYNLFFALYQCIANVHSEINPQQPVLELITFEVYTKCRKGILLERDYFIFKNAAYANPTIDFSIWRKSIEVVMETTVTGEYTHICTIDLHSCSPRLNNSCYCEEIVKDSKYNVNYHPQPPTLEMSGRNIKFSWNRRDDDTFKLYSDPQSAPQVYSVKNVRETLYVNDRRVNFDPDECYLTIGKGVNTIKYCCENAPSPCLASILEYPMNKTQGDPCAIMIFPYTEPEAHFKFSYSLCGIEKGKNVSCRFKIGVKNVRDTLYVNDKPMYLDPDECSVIIFKGVNTIKYCCENAPSPCLATILEYPMNKTQGDPCAIITHPDETAKFQLKFSYSPSGIENNKTLTCKFEIVDCQPRQTLTVFLEVNKTVLGLPGTVRCRWTNACPGKLWFWTLRSDSGIVYKYSWKENTLLNITQDPRLSLQYTDMRDYSGFIVLKMSKTICSDNGDFTCLATYVKTENISPEASYTSKFIAELQPTGAALRYVAPPLVELTRGVLENTTVSVACSAYVPIDCKGCFTWQLFHGLKADTDDVFSSMVTVKKRTALVYGGSQTCGCVVNSNATIVVKRIHHTAYLRCTLRNSTFFRNTTAEAANFKVLYGVSNTTVKVNMQPIMIYEGDVLTLHCEAEGNPVPSIQWMDPQNNSLSKGSYILQEGKAISTLVFQVATTNEAGVYVCIAENTVLSQEFIAMKEVSVSVIVRDDDTSRRRNIILLIIILSLVLACLLAIAGWTILKEKKAKREEPVRSPITEKPESDDYTSRPESSSAYTERAQSSAMESEIN